MSHRHFKTLSCSTLSVTLKRDIFPFQGKEKLPSMEEGRVRDESKMIF
jgi:hypothetical protein